MRIDDLASAGYRGVLARAHESAKWGGGGRSHVDDVAQFAALLEARTCLDYGCGRSTLKPALREVESPLAECREYDPGIAGKDAMPEPADLVVSTDVLEHIEPELVSNVLRHVRSLSVMGTFLVIAITKAKFVLPDGRNAHLTIRDAEWWLEALRQANFRVTRVERRKGIYVWCQSREER